MRAFFRSAFQALRRPGNKQLVLLTTQRRRSVQPRSVKLTVTPPNNNGVHGFRIFSSAILQRRCYASAIENKDPEDAIKSGFDILDSNPSEALKIFTKLQDQHCSNDRVLYGKASALTQLNRTTEALAILDHLSKIYPDAPVSGLKGNIHLRQGNFELAAANFEDALKRYPENSQLLGYLGEVYFKLGKKYEALDLLEKALKLSPNDWQNMNRLSLAYKETGPSLFHQALVLALQAVQLQPNVAFLWSNLALLFDSVGEMEAAAEGVDRALALDSSSPHIVTPAARLLVRLNRADEAEQIARPLVMRQKSDYAWLANLYMIRKKYSEARSLAEHWTASNPFDRQAWFYLACSHIPSDLDTSITCFSRALAIDPDNPNLIDGIGSSLWLKGDKEHAFEYYQRQPQHLGSALILMHMYDEAEALFTELLATFPHMEPLVNKGRMQLAVWKGDYAKEFECNKKALANSNSPIDKLSLLLFHNDFEGAMIIANNLRPDSLERTALQCYVLLEAGRNEEAAELLGVRSTAENLEDLPQIYVETCFLTWSTCRELNSLDEVIDACQRYPTLYAANIALSEVYRRKGEYEKALNSWTKAQYINNSQDSNVIKTPFPTRFAALRQKAMILESMGDIEGAVKEYHNVLTINPNDLVSQRHLAALKIK